MNRDTAPQGPDLPRRICARVARVTGFTEAQLCSRARFPELLAARYLVWVLCLKRGYSSGQIARSLGVDDSTVRKAYNKIRDKYGEFPVQKGGYPFVRRSTLSPIFTCTVLGTFSSDMAYTVDMEAGKELNECKKVVE